MFFCISNSLLYLQIVSFHMHGVMRTNWHCVCDPRHKALCLGFKHSDTCVAIELNDSFILVDSFTVFEIKFLQFWEFLFYVNHRFFYYFSTNWFFCACSKLSTIVTCGPLFILTQTDRSLLSTPLTVRSILFITDRWRKKVFIEECNRIGKFCPTVLSRNSRGPKYWARSVVN